MCLMKKKHIISWSLFGVLFFAFASVDQYSNWNQYSRLDLLHAMISKGTLAIDGYDGNTGDKQQIADHYYSEKAPGGAFLALPAFLLADAALKVTHIDLDSPSGWTISQWVATAGSVGLLTALGGVCFFLFLCEHMRTKSALIATLAIFLGSMTFPYATMLFSHGATMALFFIALWAFDRTERNEDEQYDYLIGFCCGMAVACEYPAAIAATAVGIAMLSLGRRRFLRFLLFALPPLLLIPAYNMAVSGNPFVLGYDNAVNFPETKEGFFGFILPNITVAWQLLFSSYRGLFFWSPVLLFSVPGFVFLAKTSRRLLLLSTLIPLVALIYVSGYVNWHGGWALGPRYLAIAVPFLAIAAGLAIGKWPRLGTVVGCCSFLLIGCATVIDALPPNDISHPISDFYIPKISQGGMAMNVGQVMGLQGWWSAMLLLVILAFGIDMLFFYVSHHGIQTQTSKAPVRSRRGKKI